MLAAVNEHESELASKLETFGKSLAQSEADFNAKVTEQLNALKPLIDGLATDLAAGQKPSNALQPSHNIHRNAPSFATPISKLN